MSNPSSAPASGPRPFTGWHMFAILCAFFGVVIAVNFIMAREAVRTFGGETVENSYVASQHFNRWLDEAAHEKALGWKVSATHGADGRVTVELANVPAGPVEVTAVARHPLGVQKDRTLHFSAMGEKRFVSREVLPRDRWRLRLEVTAAGTRLRAEDDLP